MILIRQTEIYAAWFDGLRDERATARISARLRRLRSATQATSDPLAKG